MSTNCNGMVGMGKGAETLDVSFMEGRDQVL
jgi:hypothetical protein